MNRIVKRLRNRKGESLLEALISILIFTMASLAMFAMFSSANSINSSVNDYTKNVAAQMVKVEKADGSHTDGAITITLPNKPELRVGDPVSIDIYGGTGSGELHAYFKK